MKWVSGVVLLIGLWMSLSCLAQDVTTSETTKLEQENVLPTRFILAETASIDQRIHDLLKNNVAVLTQPERKISLAELRLMRFSVRREITEILSTEGYFSPKIQFENQSQHQQTEVQIKILLGPPTRVENVQIDFVGNAIPVELQQSIRSQWALKNKALFRNDEWNRAKTDAIQSLTAHGYAAAKISHSEAVIQHQQADLTVSLDSGPIFKIGELHIQGLHLYQPWLVDRYHPPVKGDVYNQENLTKFQRELQNSSYFSAVTVNVYPDIEQASAVPIEVIVQEREEHDVGLGAGYSTNTGARGELSFRDRNFYGDAYDLRSVLRIEQRRQIGYADIYLPPKPSGYLDSFGVLFDRSDISGLLTKTSSFGAKRIITKDAVEKRLGLSFVYEQSMVNGGTENYTKALVGSIGRTWRSVNNVFDPRDGHITQVDIGVAAKAALSDQNFVRLYGKYQQWIPVGLRDVVILRAEGGYVIASKDEGIPEDYLFRAGGTASVRGYSYQSLGVSQASGVAGGRVLMTTSAEYDHWLNENWGIAGFVDVGDAADQVADLKTKQGIGMGMRYKTPAGPIALDLAYGRQVHKVRLDFSIGIAF